MGTHTAGFYVSKSILDSLGFQEPGTYTTGYSEPGTWYRGFSGTARHSQAQSGTDLVYSSYGNYCPQYDFIMLLSIYAATLLFYAVAHML